jgi:hypothetical protein
MLTRVAVAALVVVSLAGARPAAAQYRVHYGYGSSQPPPTEPSITPYVGYMNLGHYVNGPLGTSASGADAGLVGAQVTLPLSPNVAVVGNVAHANSTLVFFEPGGDPTVGNSEVWLFDGDLQLSSPFRGAGGHWVEPFVQLGAGAMHYSTQNDIGNEGATNFAFNVGLGLNYSLTRAVGIQVLGKDYVGHWNINPPVPFQSGDRFTNNYSISAGLSIGLGR